MCIRMLFIKVWILTGEIDYTFPEGIACGDSVHVHRGVWGRVVATQGIDSRDWTMLCVCDRCVVSCEIATFDIWTHPH